MNQIVVGISDLKVSGNIGDVLITYALGSCIGVAVYDPSVKVGGLLHYMLPDSSIDGNKAKKIRQCLPILGYLSFLNPVTSWGLKKSG